MYLLVTFKHNFAIMQKYKNDLDWFKSTFYFLNYEDFTIN